LFFYLNASKAGKEKYRQEKTKKNNSSLIANHKESDLKITHWQFKKKKMTLTLV
jgi:hypothetical protein